MGFKVMALCLESRLPKYFYSALSRYLIHPVIYWPRNLGVYQPGTRFEFSSVIERTAEMLSRLGIVTLSPVKNNLRVHITLVSVKQLRVGHVYMYVFSE
jgi:hypothetical protein